MATSSPDMRNKVTELRGGLYRILALTLLQPPSAEIVNFWNDPEFRDELGVFFSGNCCDELEQGLKNVTEIHGIREIKLAFDALFSVPIKGKSVTPYESVYREDYFIEGKPRKLLMGKSAQAVKNFVESTGLEAPIEARELPDHIGMELLLMASMCNRENEEREGGNQDNARAWMEKQQSFLENHLMKWIVPLSCDIRERSSHHFLRAITTMMVELVEKDFEYLMEELSPN